MFVIYAEGIFVILYKRHKDAVAYFNKEYVKTEVFPRGWEEK